MKRIAFIALWLAASPALADHPGDRLDEIMAEREAAFEETDTRDLPKLQLATGSGVLSLAELSDQILVLSFVSEDCGDACAEQQAKLDIVREDVAVTPMRDMVTFLAVRPQSIGAAEGNVANWREGAPRPGSRTGGKAHLGPAPRSQCCPKPSPGSRTETTRRR